MPKLKRGASARRKKQRSRPYKQRRKEFKKVNRTKYA